ncbi:hypothetical protein FNX44_023585 [Streptomyces sp. OF1]|uniref:Uncharacterized protein n=1 Tax=Streptomyces alkaliterrae TaxID=2213162 RepID=A0A5P0YWY1_9ACTN|nr:hypothetical protein [Streptomyces alkaliterrae]
MRDVQQLPPERLGERFLPRPARNRQVPQRVRVAVLPSQRPEQHRSPRRVALGEHQLPPLQRPRMLQRERRGRHPRRAGAAGQRHHRHHSPPTVTATAP